MCSDDFDCSLGGECTGSACVCDVWWTGPTCALLNLAPADPAASGLVAPGYFSWGGHPLEDADGTFHLLASFLCDHATLGSWTTKSSIAHATARSPTGPYELAPGADAQLVVPPWSHGAYVTRDPPTGEYLLIHIGNGLVDKRTWAPCYNSSEDEPDFAAAARKAAAGVSAAPRAPSVGSGDGIYVERAQTLAGPWASFANNTGLVVNFPANSWAHSLTNPAPFIFENGTTLMYYRADACPEGWGLAPACIGVAVADTWQGPYTSLGTQPITRPEGEDPAVFRDPRGNFHMLTNVNTYHARCAAGVPCGGHAWSRDGLTWSNQTVGAFGPVVRWLNGSYTHGAYAERPQVLQSADGTPVSFHTGFGIAAYEDSHNFAQLFCTRGRADCGPTHPPTPPPPTVVKITQGGKCLVANASVFPCAGGWADSCPLVLGDCSDPTAVWDLDNATGALLSNADPRYAGSVNNVDCNHCSAGTILKVTNNAAYASVFAVVGDQLQIAECAGMCASGTWAGKRDPPCGGAPGKPTEWTLPMQLAIVECASEDAAGWAIVR